VRVGKGYGGIDRGGCFCGGSLDLKKIPEIFFLENKKVIRFYIETIFLEWNFTKYLNYK